MTENTMITALADAGWGNSRWMLLGYIREKHREACDLCSPQCPLTSVNIFEEICDAIEKRDSEGVERLLVEMADLSHAMEKVRRVANEVQIVIEALPQIWGRNNLGDDDG